MNPRVLLVAFLIQTVGIAIVVAIIVAFLKLLDLLRAVTS